MTDSTRQQLCQVLAELSELCPEMRMGQLIANLATVAKGATAEAIWDVEDLDEAAVTPHLKRRPAPVVTG